MQMIETDRLAALNGYGVLDTLPEESFDRLTQLAAELFDAPIALVSLLDETRQWFKSHFGLAATETPRSWAFCEHAIALGPNATFVVEDTSTDIRFSTNPLVTGDPHIRFYAGAALTTPGGQNLGTLCVIDTKQRPTPSASDMQRLTTLARIVVGELEMRRNAQAASEKQRLLGLAETMSGVGHWRLDARGNQISWSDEVYRIHGVSRESFNPNLDDGIAFYHPDDQASVAQFVERALVHQQAFAFQLRLSRADGSLRHVMCRAECELGLTGETTGVVGVFQDVTDHVVALAAAAEESRRAAVAEEIAGLGHWRVDFPRRDLTWSDQMYAIYGLDRTAVLDIETVMAMTHPDDLNLTQDRLDRDLAGEHLADRPTVRIVRSDGAVRWVMGDTKVEKDQNGRILAMVGTLMDVSRQKEAERLIAESEARYRLLTENSHDLIIKSSPAAMLEYVSPSVTALLGYQPAEIVGRSAESLVYPPDLVRCRKTFAAAVSGIEVERDDYRLLHKDGSTVWVDARPRALRDAATGEITGVTDVIRDVSARRAAETALASSEAKFRLLADNASDIVTEAGLDGRFRYVSPAAEAITGFTAEEVIGRQAIDFVHPDDKARVKEEIEASITKPGGPQIEHRHICKDGRTIWVESRPTLARDPVTGKPFAVTDVLRDITARKEAEAALAATETRYRYLADHASDMIARYDREGVFLYLSPAIEPILGYAPEELIGTSTFKYIHPDDCADVALAYARYIKAGVGAPSPRVEYRTIRKDGTLLWFEAHPRALYDSEGRVYEFMDIVRDITARKAMEQELEQARATAEAATVVKSEFLSNMSHELRTPLTSILGFSSILETETGLTDQGRRAVERVSGSSQALLTIVNDILDFSKLESGQVEIDRRPADPGRVLRNALGLLDPQAEAKGLTLSISGDTALPPCVSLDDGRIRQILLNLVGNGVKFTGAGSVELKVQYDAHSERLRCEVIDSGPGVPPDRLDRLFKRFSQVDASTTRAFGGTGLGLAICKGLVEAMGGEIGVTSELGHGACFWFELPCPIAAPLLDTFEGAGDHDSNDLEGLRLLVTDDNPINRELVRVMLAPHGVEITEAEHGEAAVELANASPFDVILMDIRMPGLDGPTAARRIREGGGPNDITPILAFTANDADSLAIGGAAAGLFDGHIGKPISPLELIATVTKWAAPCMAVPTEAAAHG